MPNKKYIRNKKNKGVVPKLPLINGKEDTRVKVVSVPCGNCIECSKKKSRAWHVRLSEEMKHQEKRGIFITFTYSDSSIYELSKGSNLKGYDLDNYIAKKSIRMFLDRWRKKHKEYLRHWFVTEIGGKGTENIHIHGVVWTDHNNEEIDMVWKYGHTFCGYVSERTISYIVKYVHKRDEKHPNYKSKIFASNGIGRAYVDQTYFNRNKFNGDDTDETYINASGYKMGLPVYYRNHIYTEEERELLWIKKLDEKKRYVLGMAIDISKDLKQYESAVKHARILNKRLGYGNIYEDKKQKDYELMNRELNYRTRKARGRKGANRK